MNAETLARILEAREKGEAIVLSTDLDSGDERLISPFDDALDDDVALAAREAAVADRSTVFETDSRRVLLHVFNPPIRVVIVGAVHIAQPLAVMARAAGYGVSIVDPRTAFASEERFPGVDLRTVWPGEALAELGLDRRTAVVTVTHDPKLDDPALEAALRSEAFYVGALGSRRTHASRLTRLAEAGFTEADTDRIRAPVGLDIGARTPGEIAVAVVAEIVGELRRGG